MMAVHPPPTHTASGVFYFNFHEKGFIFSILTHIHLSWLRLKCPPPPLVPNLCTVHLVSRTTNWFQLQLWSATEYQGDRVKMMTWEFHLHPLMSVRAEYNRAESSPYREIILTCGEVAKKKGVLFVQYNLLGFLHKHKLLVFQRSY